MIILETKRNDRKKREIKIFTVGQSRLRSAKQLSSRMIGRMSSAFRSLLIKISNFVHVDLASGD